MWFEPIRKEVNETKRTAILNMAGATLGALALFVLISIAALFVPKALAAGADMVISLSAMIAPAIGHSANQRQELKLVQFGF